MVDYNSLSEAEQIDEVKQYAWAIEFIENPSEAVQLVAVKENAWAVECIKNPSPAVLCYIVARYVENQKLLEHCLALFE